MRIPFDDNWQFAKAGAKRRVDVTLPHDAMLSEKRSDESAGGKGISWFEGGAYVYEKSFDRPACGAVFVLEFEGVYRNAEVWLNGEKIFEHENGYTGFFVDVTRNLREFGNALKVIANNEDVPNSRWYSGAGIYRSVWLHCLPERHILPNGIRIDTIDAAKRQIRVLVRTNCGGEVRAEVCGRVKSVRSDGRAAFVFSLPEAELWSAEHSVLHVCKVSFCEDERSEKFGIRSLVWNAAQGFLINGERTILRGACVHHDNGILGACSYQEAEYRKIRILKENGYNAIRSAHNPCSKALLDACDRLGMYVIDELSDVWYLHKTCFDYASSFLKNWRQDVADLVQKDQNHPCVVMYSVGNENTESAFPNGIALIEEMVRVFHALDETRPVTCGINPTLNWIGKMSGEKGNDKPKQSKKPRKKGAKGSEFFNRLAGAFSSRGMLFAAKMRACDQCTRDAFAKLDIAGYNYGISRYCKDLKRYPDRLILGTETFCRDASAFWRMAKNAPRLIGDFVWTGIDHLGEVGLGSWEYEDYAPDFSGGCGWMSSGCGRIDLIGNPTAEAAYTRVAFGLEEKPLIAVVPVNHTKDRHTVSAWKMSNAVCSWSWNGCEGKSASVEVYSSAYAVTLYLNGKKIGKKKVRGCIAKFRCTYRGGEIVAVALNRAGKEINRSSMRTAGDETMLRIVPEQARSRVGEVCFFRFLLTDRAGTVKPLARTDIKLKVSGGTLLGFGSACPYNERGYLSDTAFAYYGQALAAIRLEGERLSVTAECAFGSASATTERTEQEESGARVR